ncbi:hypothetical protein [Sinomonas halotolerans]|uniref:Uncharacterized protein n=1 Tax=Sinomonas halotolerans TaxID=1644133 RepID=A0ABU9X3Q2_9MICC
MAVRERSGDDGRGEGSAEEVEAGDLQELIFLLTQDLWQPSRARYRMNVAYRGASSTGQGLETSLARLRGQPSGPLEGTSCGTSANTRTGTHRREGRCGTGRDAEGEALPVFFEPPSLDERIINPEDVYPKTAAPDPADEAGPAQPPPAAD